MTDRNLSLSISLAFHGAILALIYTLGSSFAAPPHPILIDFSLADREPPPAGPPGQPPPSGPAARPTMAAQQKTREQPQPRPNPLVPLPEPVKQPPAPQALEPAGPVAVSAAPGSAFHAPSGDPGRAAVTAQASGSGNQGKPGGSSSGSGQGHGAEPSQEQLRTRYRAEHFAYIKRIIQENISYPAQARRLQWYGTCQISFLVSENGQVSEIRIQKSTGHALLDENVVETIKRAAPFPRPPVSVRLIIPFTYNIN